MENNRLDIFKEELNMIDDLEIRRLVELGLLSAPEYFFSVPASVTGKYHPDYGLGEGGLVRHTKAAVKIADSLLVLEQYNELNKSEVVASLILHDVIKKGFEEEKYTSFEHPLLASEHVLNVYEKHFIELPDLTKKVNNIASMIESHMGQWNRSHYSKQVLPKPTQPAEQFVHLCDYLASRKFLECKFDWFSHRLFYITTVIPTCHAAETIPNVFVICQNIVRFHKSRLERCHSALRSTFS